MFGRQRECKERRSEKSLHGAASLMFHVTKYTLKHDLQTNNYLIIITAAYIDSSVKNQQNHHYLNG